MPELGPVKNDWKAYECARMWVARDAYVNNLDTQLQVLARLRAGLQGCGPRASCNRSLEIDSVNVWATGPGSM